MSRISENILLKQKLTEIFFSKFFVKAEIFYVDLKAFWDTPCKCQKKKIRNKIQKDSGKHIKEQNKNYKYIDK